ncbi:cysteine--tRNA ligase [bacterium]|nr:MAG: cysteine--tRNA ligase [bacterium]
MPILIYNSLSRKKEEFKPLQPRQIKMYVCGPTVYDQPHIGHARSAYIFDVIRRYLIYKYRDYKFTFVRNVTDVDDKIIQKAKEEYKGEDLNSAVQKVAKKYLDAYHEDMRQLGILDPDVEPKATEYIPAMQKFIQELIKRDAAYVSGGDVYFDIRKAKDYGKLSHQAIEKMEAGARVAAGEKKKDPLDFALWKSAKENEPSWDSPWGKGRPGWHIECSVMSSDILGDEFDIHGGGLDLIFPHHENEIAQSEGAGKKFARYWIHHGLLTINGQKMSKSLGNFITVKGFIERYKYPDLLKLLFLSTHYLHPVDYTEEKIKEAKEALERISILWGKINGTAERKVANNIPDELEAVKNKFVAAMDDDFNTPQGLAAIFELVNITNKNLSNKDFVSVSREMLMELTKLFGLGLSVTVTPEPLALQSGLHDEIKILIKQREEARKVKDFKKSDSIRKELEEQGIILEDTKEGTAWRRKL